MVLLSFWILIGRTIRIVHLSRRQLKGFQLQISRAGPLPHRYPLNATAEYHSMSVSTTNSSSPARPGGQHVPCFAASHCFSTILNLVIKYAYFAWLGLWFPDAFLGPKRGGAACRGCFSAHTSFLIGSIYNASTTITPNNNDDDKKNRNK